MRAVTFQGPRRVSIEERPRPELQASDDAIIAVSASGICGSDLHIYHGRVQIEPGFTLGHEFVGTVLCAGPDVVRVKPGDRVLGSFYTACGTCSFCLRGAYQKCARMRVFGHGSRLGSLQGTQADQVLVPMANLTLRKAPDALSDDLALFAGDVMATAYHAVSEGGVRPGDSVAVAGLGPVGLCTVQVAVAAGASPVFAIDRVEDRLEVAQSFGGVPVHLEQENPSEIVKRTTRHGVDVAIEAVGHADALELALRVVRSAGTVIAVGVYAERCGVHMGLVWIKSLTLKAGQANVTAHMDRVTEMLAQGSLDPSPLVTHRMSLEQAKDAYDLYDRHEALKIVLTP